MKEVIRVSGASFEAVNIKPVRKNFAKDQKYLGQLILP